MENKLDIIQLNDVSKQEDSPNMQSLERSTKLERVLCFSTTISLFTVAILAVCLVFLGFIHYKSTEPGERSFISLNDERLLPIKNPVSNVCLTPGCVKAAAEILSNLDENVKPCDDFYRFACGGWLNRNTIAEHRSEISRSLESYDSLNVEVKALLEKEVDGTEPAFIQKLKNLYHTCTNLKDIEKAGTKPLRKILKSVGGWPVVEGRTWDEEEEFDWVETLISLRKHGYELESLFFSLTVGVDKQNNSLHVIEIDVPFFPVTSQSLIWGLNDTSTAAYFKMMVKAAQLLGANKAAAERELLEALQFEMTLGKFAGPFEGRTHNVSKFYNKFTVKELDGMVPEIPWLELFNGVLNDEIFENDSVVIALPEFVVKLGALIEDTDKRVIANYMLWRVVFDSLDLLSKPWRDILIEYYTVLFGFRNESPRWLECLYYRVYSKFSIAVGSYYVSHYFKKETKDAASELVKYLHQETLYMLDEINWMDNITKTHAKAKVNDMIFYTGYPEELLNNSVVEDYYQNLSISSDSYFENILRLRKWSTDNYFSMLRKHRRRRDWKEFAGIAPPGVYLSNQDNSIGIIAGILRSPYFREDRPNYLNFGALGLVISQEIVRAIFDEGRQYGKNGNSEYWWTKTTDEQFKKKAQCIIDQYSNYTENGMNMNSHIKRRNIVDNGAMKEAYLAYQTWVKENGPEEVLPGLKYSQNQLFWISAANIRCTKYRSFRGKRRYGYDSHRVIGPMSNLAEFAEDFNCLLQSPMNPKHKCQVW